MNYYEYLNRRLAANGTNNDYTVSTPPVINPFGPSLFINSANSVNYNGQPLFTSASKEDLSKIDYDKILKPQGGENAKLSPLEFVLKEFFSIDAVKKQADKDGNGVISKEEAQSYVEELAKKDGDGETLSLADFEAISTELGLDFDSMLNVLNDNSTVVSEPQGAQAAPAFQYSGGYAASSGVSQAKTLDNMNLSELQTERTTRQSTLTQKQNALNAVYSGENPQVKAAKVQKEQAQKAYEAALKNDAGAASKILKNNKEIDKNQAELDKTEIEINQKEAAISAKESEISAADSEITSLESVLSQMPSPTGKEEDKQKDEKINERKKQLTKEIDSKKKALEKQKSALEKLKKELTKLEKKKADLETEKIKLAEEKAKLDELVNQNCTAYTRQKLEAFNKAKANLETVKTKEAASARSEVQKAQTALNEVDKKITEKNNSMVGSILGGDAGAIETALEFLEANLGARENGSSNDGEFMRLVKHGAKNNLPWCAYTVCYALELAGLAGKTTGYTGSSQEIKRKAQNAGCYAGKNSGYTPQRGDLAMWTNAGGATGHVGMVSQVYPDGSFDVIEGNSGNALRKRHYSSVNSAGASFNGFVQMNKWTQMA